jgi:tetratricopeptide (TPR) repeat protein
MKEYLFTQFSVILTYLHLFIWPINQNLDYDYQLSTSFFQLKTFFSFSLLLCILAAGVLLFKRYRLISFAIFWFFLTISVESSIIPISQNVIFEHRTYLSGFGFFLALTSTFFYFFKEKYLKVAVIVLLMIAAINTVLTYQRNKVWKNEYTLWTDCVKKSPNKARTNNNLCFALLTNEKNKEAVDYCNKAISKKPDYATAYNNRALAYDNLGQSQRAIEDYSKAINIKPDYSLAYYNRGFFYHKRKLYEQAIEDYSKAVNLQPDFSYAYNKRGSAYFALGNYQRAIEDYDKVIHLQPDYADTYNNRGSAYYKFGNYQRAIEDYDKAINIQPDFTEAYKNRSGAYLTQGKESLGCSDAQKACSKGDCTSLEWAKSKGLCRPENREKAVDLVNENRETAMDWIKKEQSLWNGSKYSDPTKAVEYLNNAIKLQQNNASYYNKRGLAYYYLNDYKSAIEDYGKAIRLNPKFYLAYYNRGCIYIKDPSQYPKAIDDFNKAIHLKSDYTEAYNNLGGVYLKQGKKSLGCSNAQKACELGNCKLIEVAKSKGYCP